MKRNKWLIRLLSFVLVLASLITSLPTSVLAKKTENVVPLYGDANTDDKIDLNDVLVLKKYIMGIEKDGINLKFSDVNTDGKTDLKDLLNLKKYLAKWDIELGPGTATVSFYDGERLVDQLKTVKGEALGMVPSNEKTSRSDGIFMGWYLDPTFETPFYADAVVNGDTKVYGKYSDFSASTLNVTSFAQVDLKPDASFTVVGTGDITEITLVPMDGSETVELSVTGEGPYTVTAKEGFTEGASYELTLPEGLDFVGSNGKTLPSTVRTASFTIAKDAVANIQMSDAVHYVQHTDPASLAAGSKVQLSSAKVGELICFYHTTDPRERDYTTGNAYMDDPETWFKVESVSGGNVVLAELDDEDSGAMYAVPDNFPVVGAIPQGDTGTLTLEIDSDGYALDQELYAQMMEKAEDGTLQKALDKLSIGDFVSIYVASDKIDGQDDIYFGKITAIEGSLITFVKSSAKEIEEAVDMFIEPVLKGDDLMSDEAAENIEKTVLNQLHESNFAEDAAYMLMDLATKTDGFRSMEGVDVLLTNRNGEPLSQEAMDLLNLGASFELSDDITLTAEIIKSGDQLHFKDKGSVQLAIGLDATFEIEVEDDGKLVIDLSAAFVQELALGVSANGSLVKKKILFIPVPIGVKVGASVDILSYTAIRVDVRGYTVAPEEQSLYDQFMDVVKNPEKLGDVLADTGKFGALAEGLKTVGDVFDKIEELEEKIEQAKEDAETALGYAEDIEMLWSMVEEMNTDNKISKEEWQEAGKALGKTNVSQDLMEMLNLSTETELDADRYAEGLGGLLEKFSEMLEKETDWVTLVEKEMCTVEVNVLGLCIYFKADFVVKADVNIAMGTSLQYQVGKRYSFWFKIGLFKPQAGSTTMDLVDESFAFQFYVMGKLGLKMGVKATVGFAIGSSKLARVGLSLEMGPYVKIYGFFLYEYERWREANTSTWNSDERMAGALYVDFGLYLEVSLEASALGDLFEVEYTFLDEEFPLLIAGNKEYPYSFHYEPLEDEFVVVSDADKNSTNGICMVLEDEYRAVSYCDLESGFMGAKAFDWDNYHVTLSNPAFSINEKGEITVKVPKDTRYMECDLTLTYKYGKLAFSTYDMQVVVPLVWTNLSLDEISQYFTASVRVGNDINGYDVVWSKRVRKNEEFTLPTEDELKELIGYNAAVYTSLSYPDAGKTDTIISNTSYDCTVSYTDYAITVSGIQNPDGTTTSQTFHTIYGGTFDFSPLALTGSNIAGTAETAKYTKFAQVVTEATVTANGQTRVIDLEQPITGKVASAILGGKVKANAVYTDDSALVTYVFSGINAPNCTERIRKGTAPVYDIYSFVANYGMAVKSIEPELDKVQRNTTYYVECCQIVGDKYTLYLEENGGSKQNDIVRVGGTIIGTLPTPTRKGYTFVGWYADKNLKTPFETRLMPKKNTKIYAKWKANSYDVTLNVNGGNSWTEGQGKVSVTFGKTYGELPVPARDGYSFQGWFTTQNCADGTQIKKDTVVSITAAQTLYAKWHKLVQIEANFTYTAPEVNPVYSVGVAVEIRPDAASWPSGVAADSFKFKFMRQGDTDYIDGYPVNAGTYDVTVSRDADDYYAAFSQTVTGVLTIDKAVRTVENPEIVVSGSGFNYMEVKLAENAIPDLHPDAKITYQLVKTDGTYYYPESGGTTSCNTASEAAKVLGLYPNSTYAVKVSVADDPNYVDTGATGYSVGGNTAAAPTDSWKNHMEPIEFQEGVYDYTITTPGQLAYLAYMVNTQRGEYTSEAYNGVDNKLHIAQFEGYTFTLGADLDLSAYTWEPIGRDEYILEVKYTTLVVAGQKYTYSTEYKYYPGFGGGFIGNGYTISGMYVDGSIATEAGENSYTSTVRNGALFGYILNEGYVSGVTLTNSYVTSAYHSAGVVSHAVGSSELRTQVDSCYSDATIHGQNTSAAGVVCNVQYGDVLDVVNAGRVTSEATDSSGMMVAAGVCGAISDATVYTCVNYGYVTGRENVGGIAGYMTAQSYVIDCVNYGDVTGTGTGDDYNHYGGVVGYVLEGNEVVNCANFGDVRAKTNCVGGIVGEHEKSNKCKTINCVNYGTVSGNKYVGSVIGRNYDNKGLVDPVYYLAYAGCPYAAGTKKGSSDSVDNVNAFSFNTPDSTLESNLNGWSGREDYDATAWVKDADGYGYIPQSVYVLLYGE